MSQIPHGYEGGHWDHGRGLKLAVLSVAVFCVLANMSSSQSRDQFGLELSAWVRPSNPQITHERVFGGISKSLRILEADKMAPVILVADFLDLESVEVARAVGHALYPRSIVPYDYRFVPTAAEISLLTARVREESSSPYVFVVGNAILRSPEVHRLLLNLRRMESSDQGVLFKVAKPR